MSVEFRAGEAAIQALLVRAVDAWNCGDADAYAGLFTVDCRYIAYFGSIYRGRQEVADSHRVLFAGPLKRTQMFVETVDLRFLDDDTVLLITRGEVGRKRPHSLAKVQTYVIRRQDDQWLIAHFQNTKRMRLMQFLTYRAGPGAVPSIDR